jgi:nucleotide-binding universal stress UspA family protein
MFERILVPLDGSLEAEAVFSPLARLLRRKDAEVALFHAVPLSLPLPMPDLDQDALDYLERKRRELEGQGLRVSTHLRPGRAADAILNVAAEIEPSLIAMSTHGRSGVVRWMLGSVTEEVLRRSAVPVFITGPNPPELRRDPGTKRTILVPFDGSEESLCVVPLAVETARLFDASVAVLRVEDGVSGGPDLGFVGIQMDGPSSLEGRPDLLDRDLIEAGNRFAVEGLRTTLFRVRGDIASKINHLARILPADAVVMASHGRQGVSRLITGSVAEEVARKAEAPVLVKRIGAAEALAPRVPERRVS